MVKLRGLKTVSQRRREIETLCSVTLPNIGTYSLDDTVAQSKHCENMIGIAQIPLGVAGPLAIKNDAMPAGRQELKITNYYIPLATAEGALVASISRGCKAITEGPATPRGIWAM